MVIATTGGGNSANAELPHCTVISLTNSMGYSTNRISQCTFLLQMLAM